MLNLFNITDWLTESNGQAQQGIHIKHQSLSPYLIQELVAVFQKIFIRNWSLLIKYILRLYSFMIQKKINIKKSEIYLLVLLISIIKIKNIIYSLIFKKDY